LGPRYLDKIATLLFSEDPRHKADKILAQLVAESGATSGAVLSVLEGRLVPYVTAGVDLDRLSAVRSLWLTSRHALLAGRTHVGKDHILSPLREGGSLAGVLFLETARTFDEEDSDILRALLAKALSAPAGGSPAIETYLAATAPEAMEREQLLLMLRKNKWNIALVARRLGVTRRTIYLRLARYEIQRVKVPKTLKRSTVT